MAGGLESSEISEGCGSIVDNAYILIKFCYCWDVNSLQLKSQAWRKGETLLTEVFLNLFVLPNISEKNHGERQLIQEACKGELLISVAKLRSEHKF